MNFVLQALRQFNPQNAPSGEGNPATQAGASFITPLGRRQAAASSTLPMAGMNWDDINRQIQSQLGANVSNDDSSFSNNRNVTLGGQQFYTERNNPSYAGMLQLASGISRKSSDQTPVNFGQTGGAEYGSILRTDPNDTSYVIGLAQGPDGNAIPVRFKKTDKMFREGLIEIGKIAAAAAGGAMFPAGGAAAGGATAGAASAGTGAATAGGLGTGFQAAGGLGLQAGGTGVGLTTAGASSGALGSLGGGFFGAESLAGLSAAAGAAGGASGSLLGSSAGTTGTAGAGSNGVLGQIGSTLKDAKLTDILSTGASAIGGIQGQNQQQAGVDRAAQLQANAAQLGISEEGRRFNELQRLLSPFVRGGTNAFGAQQSLLGLNGGEQQQSAIASLQNSPMFQALVTQGEEGILQNASATGGLRGGNVQSALAQFRPQILAQLIQQQFDNLGGLSQYGQASAAGVGAAGQRTGTAISNLLQQQGAAQAGQAISQGNTDASNISNLLKFGGMVAGRLF